MSSGFRSVSLRLSNFIVLSALIFAFSNELSANDVYVATYGSNANSGTSNAPVRTIQFGLSRLHPGDTLIIRGGTYTEGIATGTIPSGIDDSRHTTIRGAAGETVILNGLTPDYDVVEIGGASYVTLDNLIVDGGANSGILLGPGGFEVHHITVKNSTIKNSSTGIDTGGRAGVNHHLVLQGLTVSNNTQHGIYLTGADSVVEDSEIYDNGGHGIHMYGSVQFGVTSRNTVRRNRIHGNGSFGLMLSSGSDNVAYNNVIYGNGRAMEGAGGFRFYDGAYNNQFINNTVYANYGPGILVQGGAGSVVLNNISYGNYADGILLMGGVNYSVISNNLTTNPGFVNPGDGNFHLLAGSDAVDSGSFVSSVLNSDIEGTPRPQGGSFDIGAYEYSGSYSGSSTTLPQPSGTLVPPTGLVAQCNGDGSFTVSWNAVAGAQNYYLRVDYQANNNSPYAEDSWYIPGSPDHYLDQYPGTSYTGSLIPGEAYRWWVHGANSVNGIGPAASGSLSCGR